jgi:hypothetical protein
MHNGGEECLDNQHRPSYFFVDLPNGDGDNFQENKLHKNNALGNHLMDQIAFQMWNDFNI